ncbi:hypothetical protein TEA_005426 [Camellia sinensis var. sinensis]|uniref:Uncharacterized protein n=1 Tax=Camellia sinensis var. sinensis TaxID=542762 RepID=A0A4S4DIV9_CAMSN|nr:hypothetical protein TEA_005426 [Camellia sinensis var. sinensis]
MSSVIAEVAIFESHSNNGRNGCFSELFHFFFSLLKFLLGPMHLRFNLFHFIISSLKSGRSSYLMDVIVGLLYPVISLQTRNATRLVAPTIAAGLGALTHTLGTLVLVIAESGFATATTATATATAIRTIVGQASRGHVGTRSAGRGTTIPVISFNMDPLDPSKIIKSGDDLIKFSISSPKALLSDVRLVGYGKSAFHQSAFMPHPIGNYHRWVLMKHYL